MMRTQKGFTLIELVMVIVILGILAAVAIPKYLDLQTKAAEAQAKGVFGAAQSAAAITYANNRVNNNACPGAGCIATGANLISAMTTTPDGWSPSGNDISATINGVAYTITVSSGETTTMPATLTKTGF